MTKPKVPREIEFSDVEFVVHAEHARMDLEEALQRLKNDGYSEDAPEVRDIRRRLGGLTQGAIAERLGLAPRQVMRIENGNFPEWEAMIARRDARAATRAAA